jgi:hypothetical protein
MDVEGGKRTSTSAVALRATTERDMCCTPSTVYNVFIGEQKVAVITPSDFTIKDDTGAEWFTWGKKETIPCCTRFFPCFSCCGRSTPAPSKPCCAGVCPSRSPVSFCSCCCAKSTSTTVVPCAQWTLTSSAATGEVGFVRVYTGSAGIGFRFPPVTVQFHKSATPLQRAVLVAFAVQVHCDQESSAPEFTGESMVIVQRDGDDAPRTILVKVPPPSESETA